MPANRSVVRPRQAFRRTLSKAMDDEELIEMIIEYFKRYAKFPTPGGEVKCITHFLQHFSTLLHNRRSADIFLECIFSTMEIYRSTNGDLIRNLLKEYIAQRLTHSIFKRNKLEPLCLLGRFPTPDIYYEITPLCRQKVSADSMFYDACILKCGSFTKKLLRYGVRFDVEDEHLRKYQEHWLMFILRNTSLKTVAYTFTAEEKAELQNLVNDKYPLYGDRRRLYFVMLAIDLVNLKTTFKCDNHCEKYAETIKLLFMTIQESLITVAEMRRLFDITLKDENNERRINDFCNVFVEMFPSSVQPLQPRSLQHLCRCRIRESLSCEKKLPHGVWSLNLPNLLKNYILLQKAEDEFNGIFILQSLFPKNIRHDYNLPSSTKRKRPRFQ